MLHQFLIHDPEDKMGVAVTDIRAGQKVVGVNLKGRSPSRAGPSSRSTTTGLSSRPSPRAAPGGRRPGHARPPEQRAARCLPRPRRLGRQTGGAAHHPGHRQPSDPPLRPGRPAPWPRGSPETGRRRPWVQAHGQLRHRPRRPPRHTVGETAGGFSVRVDSVPEYARSGRRFNVPFDPETLLGAGAAMAVYEYDRDVEGPDPHPSRRDRGLNGSGSVRVGDRAFELTTGTAVHTSPGFEHQTHGSPKEGLRLVALFSPGLRLVK